MGLKQPAHGERFTRGLLSIPRSPALAFLVLCFVGMTASACLKKVPWADPFPAKNSPAETKTAYAKWSVFWKTVAANAKQALWSKRASVLSRRSQPVSRSSVPNKAANAWRRRVATPSVPTVSLTSSKKKAPSLRYHRPSAAKNSPATRRTAPAKKISAAASHTRRP